MKNKLENVITEIHNGKFYQIVEKLLEGDNSEKSQNHIAEEILHYEGNIFIGEDLNKYLIPIDRKKGYNEEEHIFNDHNDKYKNKELYTETSKKGYESSEKEKTMCKRLFQICKDGSKIHKNISILDFEVPVIHSSNWRKNAAVDIVGADDKNIYLFEAKSFDAEDSLLRCITEIKTYHQKIIKHKAIEKDCISASELFKFVYGEKQIVPAILIFEGFDKDKPIKQYDTLSKINNNDCVYLKKLAQGIHFFIIKEDDGKLSLETKKSDIESMNFTIKEYKY